MLKANDTERRLNDTERSSAFNTAPQPCVPDVPPFKRAMTHPDQVYNDFPTIVVDYKNTSCGDCRTLKCYDNQKIQCFLDCQAWCEKSCCGSDPIVYEAKTNQSLIIIHNKNDIYGHLVGPGTLEVCCENNKSFHWINTGVQTVRFPDFNTLDSDLKPLTVGLLVTYRITDLTNYIFNTKDKVGMELNSVSAKTAGKFLDILTIICDFFSNLIKALYTAMSNLL